MARARGVQAARFEGMAGLRVNADMEGALLERDGHPRSAGQGLLTRVAERMGLTARGYHRVLRVARTIADLDGSAGVRQPHVAEAISYRLTVGPKG